MVTGSSASVCDEDPWSEASAALLRDAIESDVPVLGVCFGHQLLGHAVGGRGTVRRAALPEVGYHDVEMCRGDALLDALPARFRTFMTHGDEVVPVAGLEVFGWSDACPVQAIRVPRARAWGVQFHLEYPLEEQVRLIHKRAARHPELGYDPDAMIAERADTAPLARALFDRFVEICR